MHLNPAATTAIIIAAILIVAFLIYALAKGDAAV